MWSILSDIEPAWLRVVAFVSLGPATWLALSAAVAANAAVAPALARARRRARRRARYLTTLPRRRRQVGLPRTGASRAPTVSAGRFAPAGSHPVRWDRSRGPGAS
jgi:hypothetical protein